MREAIARSPESAAAVRAALQKRRGEDGDNLYRVLWGYSDEQLRDKNEDATLVNYLSHESQDYRVLAFLTLKQITGGEFTHLYRPEVSERRRATSTQRWKQDEQDGAIVYKRPPSLPTFRPVSATDEAKGSRGSALPDFRMPPP